MAPPMAADMLGLPPFTVAELAREMAQDGVGPASVFVEGAGGPRSPIASDGDNVDLAARSARSSRSSWPMPGSAPSTRCG